MEQMDTDREGPAIPGHKDNVQEVVDDQVTICDGKFVMLRLPSENFRVVKLTAGTNINLGKFGSFAVDDIIGKPFGFTYEIENEEGSKKLSIVNNLYELDDSEEGITELEPSENNRDLLDHPDVQALKAEQIEELKKQGLSGQEIIERVKASHSSFTKKTAFSQEKYIKRKQQKFLQRFTPEPIGSSELIDIYLDKDPGRIMDLSVESLGLVLSQGNIQPGGKYLVVDDMAGVLVSALLERMGGEGLVVVAHEHEHPNLDAMKFMNFDPDMVKRMVKTINWLDFFHPEEADEFEYMSDEQLHDLKPSQRGQYHRKKSRYEDLILARDLIDNNKFDALVVATKLDLPELVPLMIPAIGGSRPIVVYSEFKEQIVDLTHVLHKDLRVLAPTIMETRVRKYQTLPGRMHPHMTSRGGGGYVLWGTRVFPSQVHAVGASTRKKRKVDNEPKDKAQQKDEERATN